MVTTCKRDLFRKKQGEVHGTFFILTSGKVIQKYLLEFEPSLEKKQNEEAVEIYKPFSVPLTLSKLSPYVKCILF